MVLPVPNASALLATATMRKGAERVEQRHVHVRSTAGVEMHASLPEQQRVEQLARRRASATAARRLRLAPVVALADHLHLRGGGPHLGAARLHHAREHVPRRIVGELEQALVHRRDGDLGVRRRRLAVRAAHLYRDARVLAHLVRVAVGARGNLESMCVQPTRTLATPSFQAGLARSTSAVS